jgi:hypothetical protein
MDACRSTDPHIFACRRSCITAPFPPFLAPLPPRPQLQAAAGGTKPLPSCAGDALGSIDKDTNSTDAKTADGEPEVRLEGVRVPAIVQIDVCCLLP